MTIEWVKQWWPCGIKGCFSKCESLSLPLCFILSGARRHLIWSELCSNVYKEALISVGRQPVAPSPKQFHISPLAPILLSSKGGLGFSSAYDGLFDTAGMFLAVFQWRLHSTVEMQSIWILLLWTSVNHQSTQTVQNNIQWKVKHLHGINMALNPCLSFCRFLRFCVRLYCLPRFTSVLSSLPLSPYFHHFSSLSFLSVS